MYRIRNVYYVYDIETVRSSNYSSVSFVITAQYLPVDSVSTRRYPRIQCLTSR